MSTDLRDQVRRLRRAPRVALLEAATQRVLVPRLTLASTFWRRFRGWQFRSPVHPDEGLLLAPCRSIHTQWMRFSIDVVSLDEQGQILRITTDVRPWRWLNGPLNAFATLELPALRAAGRLEVGLQISLQAAS
ncbi:MAG: DUF192 domain-containing protein [Pirellulales bacterium]